MNFEDYGDQINEVFQDNPIFVLDNLLKNHDRILSVDIIKLTIDIQRNWKNYQSNGVNLLLVVDTDLKLKDKEHIKNYNFNSDIQKIKMDPEIMSCEYIICKNGFISNKIFKKNILKQENVSYTSFSLEKIIFFLGINGPDTFINGVIYKSSNNLSSYADMVEWKKMLGINNYSELLEKFFQEYVQFDNFKRYFLQKDSVGKDIKAQLSKFPKILINKPEEKFQLDLLKFLKDNCKDYILKEVHNNENERYDIWVGTDQDDVYIFEIKWLGKSITPSGNINSKYDTTDRAIEGAHQLLDYINNQERTLKGYPKSRINLAVLLIYDAREEMDDIVYPEELREVASLDLTKHFKIEKTKVNASKVYKFKRKLLNANNK